MTGNFAYRVSPQQARLWHVQEDGHPFRTICQVHLQGKVSGERLQRALVSLTSRHEILRTTFYCEPGLKTPLQRVHDHLDPVLREVELDAKTGHALDAELAVLGNSMCFVTLDQGPLFLATLAHAGEMNALLLLCLPALCMDNTGLDNLVEELAVAYRGQQHVDDAPLQYPDVAKWLAEIPQGDDSAEGRVFWADEAHTRTQFPALPFERRSIKPRPYSRAFVTRTVLEQGANDGADPFELLSCAWRILLSRITGLDELVVATAFDGREDEDLEKAIGLFTRFLPIVVQVTPHHSSRDLFRRMERPMEEAREWEDHFCWLMRGEEASQRGDLPPFPFAFEFLEGRGSFDGGGVSLTLTGREALLEPFKLLLSCEHVSSSIVLKLFYDVRLFSESAAGILLDQFISVLNLIRSRPDLPIRELDCIGPQERERLLKTWNNSDLEL